MPLRPRRFQVSAKNYFLTYPQCSLSKEDALDQLKSINTPVNKKFIKICRERHDDGNYHLHVLLQFQSKYICTNKRLFDLVSPTGSTRFHPNIQGARSSSDVRAYIEKDGETVQWGEFQIDARSSRTSQLSIAQVYSDALNSGSAAVSLQIIKERDPKTFFLQFHNISANALKIFNVPPEPFISKWSSSSFIVPDSLSTWAAANVVENAAARPDRPISIVIEGESRLGKTAWARSLGRHNYLMGHLDFNSKIYSNDVTYNVIDDVAPKYLLMKHWKELLGAQRNWQSNCKYSKPVQIKGGIPSIVLCNPGPESSFKEFLDRDENKALKIWTLQNVKFEFLHQRLYSSPSPEIPPRPVEEV